MIRSFVIAAAIASTLAPALAADATYRADPVHSSATFTATHLAISHVSGVIPIQAASVTIPDGSNIPASATATFNIAGIDTRNNDRDSDLRSPHFFDVATYPKMEFASTKIAGTDATHFTMTGDLTMHGQTHPVTLQGEYIGRTTDQRGRTHIGYSAKGTIDRTQWGMTYGPLIVSNNIDLDVEVEAVK